MRVREQMSKADGHDIRKLIADINERRDSAASPIIDPGTKAEKTDLPAKAKIDRAEAAIARGEVVSQEDVVRRSREWFESNGMNPR